MLLSLNMTLKTISGKNHPTYKQGHMVIINYCDTTKTKIYGFVNISKSLML